jgi:multiple antibiotic resistance protein
MNFKEIFSVSLILFSVIDIIGSVPFIILIKKREGRIYAEKATIISAVLMVGFLYLGQSILTLFGLDVASFAVAGAIVIFIVAMEMILGITLIKDDPEAKGSGSIVPLAFPLIAGAGTLTTILSLRAVYEETNVLIGIFVNLIFRVPGTALSILAGACNRSIRFCCFAQSVWCCIACHCC